MDGVLVGHASTPAAYAFAGSIQPQEVVMYYRVEQFRIKRLAALALATAGTLLAALSVVIG